MSTTHRKHRFIDSEGLDFLERQSVRRLASASGADEGWHVIVRCTM